MTAGACSNRRNIREVIEDVRWLSILQESSFYFDGLKHDQKYQQMCSGRNDCECEKLEARHAWGRRHGTGQVILLAKSST